MNEPGEILRPSLSLSFLPSPKFAGLKLNFLVGFLGGEAAPPTLVFAAMALPLKLPFKRDGARVWGTCNDDVDADMEGGWWSSSCEVLELFPESGSRCPSAPESNIPSGSGTKTPGSFTTYGDVPLSLGTGGKGLKPLVAGIVPSNVAGRGPGWELMLPTPLLRWSTDLRERGVGIRDDFLGGGESTCSFSSGGLEDSDLGRMGGEGEVGGDDKTTEGPDEEKPSWWVIPDEAFDDATLSA